MPTEKDPIYWISEAEKRIAEAARSAWRAIKRWAAQTAHAANDDGPEDRAVEKKRETFMTSNEIVKSVWDGLKKYSALAVREAQKRHTGKCNAGDEKKSIFTRFQMWLDEIGKKIAGSARRAKKWVARAVWNTIKNPLIIALMVLAASVIVTHNYTFFWRSQAFKEAHADAIARGKSEKYAITYASVLEGGRDTIYAEAYAEAREAGNTKEYAGSYALQIEQGRSKAYANGYAEAFLITIERDYGIVSLKYIPAYAEARSEGKRKVYADAYALAKSDGYKESVARFYAAARNRGTRPPEALGYAFAKVQGHDDVFAVAYGKGWKEATGKERYNFTDKKLTDKYKHTFANAYASAYLEMKKREGSRYTETFAWYYASHIADGYSVTESYHYAKKETENFLK